MNEIGVVNIVLILLVFVVLLVLVFIILKIKNDEKPVEVSSEQKAVHVDIKLDDLIHIVSNERSSRQKISSAVFDFVENFPFPAKKDDKISDESKMYLNFILLLASHKNADAKLIAYANKELKKRNPDYLSEIDIYEDQGIEQRKHRAR